jgi:RNA polymerase sigma-32 factor
MTSKALAIPALSTEDSLKSYMQQIRKFPMLTAEEEYMLAKRWTEHGDYDAAHRLVTSHLRLVAKIANGYKGYGLPTADLISEGNIGLMQAVKRFEPERGFKLATYAMWWIKAAIQEYILRSWSLVKMGTSAAHKRLFFNLRKMKKKLHRYDSENLTPQEVQEIANELGVKESEVMEMDQRMSTTDKFLNSSMNQEGEGEWMDMLADESASQESVLADAEELDQKRALLVNAMDNLNEREKHIIAERRLKENPSTLEELSQQYNISRERVRQIEARAIEKLQKEMVAALPAA